MPKLTPPSRLAKSHCRTALEAIGCQDVDVHTSGGVLRLAGDLHLARAHETRIYEVRIALPLPSVRTDPRAHTAALRCAVAWLEAMVLLVQADLASPRDLLLAWIVRQGGPAEGKCVRASLDGNDCLLAGRDRGEP